MNESGLKRRVIAALSAAGLDPHSVENIVHPGTPDIDYAHGWIELKHAATWPTRGGVLSIPHFTPQQRVWLQRRWHAGGHAYLLLQVDKDYLLFTGCVAARLVGRGTRMMLKRHCLIEEQDFAGIVDFLQNRAWFYLKMCECSRA